MIRADAGAADARARSRGVDIAPVLRFTRDAGVYTAQSDGHANRYQLFVERAMALTRRAGRLGLVLPSGLATDHGSAPLRRRLFSRVRRRRAGRHRQPPRRLSHPSQRPVSAGDRDRRVGDPRRRVPARRATIPPRSKQRRRGAARDSPWFPVRLTPALIRHLSGDDLAIPDLRTRDRPRDRRARRGAVSAARQRRRAWAARFGRELNATRRSRAFRRARHGPAGRRGQAPRAVSRRGGAGARPALPGRRRGALLDPSDTSARASPIATSPAPPTA